MNKRQKTGLKLLIAAFVFGMATGYLGALWQICAQKSLRARQEMRVSPVEAGSASVAAGGGSKVSEQSSSASVALTGSKGPSAGGAVEAADAAAPEI